jgi:predicted RNase H-like HicB family nuclease
MNVSFEAVFWQEGQQVVAHAMPIDVATCGETREEAERALVEAARLFLETARDAGTLEEILFDAGYVPSGDDWILPRKDQHPQVLSAGI